MNLTWAEGTEEDAMQTLCDHYLTKHEEPLPRLRVRIKGTTDTLQTQIFTREISDLLTIVQDNLDINDDYYIDSITIQDGPADIPSCLWIVEKQRTEEALTLFLIGTSELDGPHVLGS